MYTLERAREVKRRVREKGERITHVCADLGMNYENFLRWCRRNNFRIHTKSSIKKVQAQPRGPYPIGEVPDIPIQPRSKGKAAAIIEEWRRGELSPVEVAAKYKVCYAYAVRLRKQAGLNPPAGRGRNQRNPLHTRKGQTMPIATRNLLIMAALDRGASVTEVAKEFNLSRQTIYQVSKYELPSRKFSARTPHPR